MKRWHRPTRSVAQLGQRVDDLAGDEVEAARARRGGSGHAAATSSGNRATRMSTRSPRNGTPSRLEQRALALALGQRAVGAHDAVPGHRRVRAAVQDGAGEARRAGRDVAVAAHEALAGSRGRAAGLRPRPSSRPAIRCPPCAGAPTRSSRATRRRASSARRCTRTGSASARSCRGSAPASARSSRSRSPSPPTARGCSTASPRGAGAGEALRRPARRRRARALPPGRGRRRRAARVAVHTGERCIAFAGHEAGPAFSAQANMMAAPEVWPAMARAFVAADGARSRGACSPRCTPPRRRAATCAAASRRRSWSRPRRARRGGAPSTCASTTTPSRSPSSTACSTSPRPTRWPPEGDDLVAHGRHDEAGRVLHARRGAGARQPRAALLGRPRRRPGRRHGHAASRACARRSRCSPAGATCSAACEPTSRRARPPCSP